MPTIQPVLAPDCATREQGSPGTIIESFCLKLLPGLAPLQRDPDWCASLRPKAELPADDAHPDPHPAIDPALLERLATGSADGSRSNPEALKAALHSRRHLLCEQAGQECLAAEGDPCVPLAAVAASDGFVVGVEECLVRPRVYSNAVLLDLILCLAQKVDECCAHGPSESPAEPMQVRSIDFLRHAGETTGQVVASVVSPLVDTAVPLERRANAIRIRFSKPFARDARRPTTPGVNTSDFERHNVQVLPQRAVKQLPYVPGSLEIEAPDTLRFDLARDTAYSLEIGVWAKGRYRLVLCGTDDAAARRLGLADLSGNALDGEPAALGRGVISGDGTPGGDFVITFTVG